MRRFLIGVSAALSMAFASMAGAAELRVTTGSDSGVYYKVGQVMSDMFGKVMKVNVQTSNGGLENLERLQRGEADAAIVQADHWALYEKRNPGSLQVMVFARPYREFVHVVCNTKWAENNGVDDLGDLESLSQVRMVMLSGGSEATWDNIVLEDDDYGVVTKIGADVGGAGEFGLLSVATGESQCGFYVAGRGASLMRTASEQFGNDLNLIEAVNDKDFNDAVDPEGKPLYAFDSFDDDGVYDYGTDFTVTWAYDTLSVEALIVFSRAWVNENPNEFKSFIRNRAALLDKVQQLTK